MTGRRTEIIHYNLLIPVAEQPGLAGGDFECSGCDSFDDNVRSITTPGREIRDCYLGNHSVLYFTRNCSTVKT